MITRLVVWGGRDSLDSFRHIMRAYYQTALKIGIASVWVDDREGCDLRPGDVVLAADVTGRNLRYVPDVDYVLHNFSATDAICEALEQTPERLLRLQVWTSDAFGKEWAPCRRFDRAGRVLFQPWGSDLLAEEFLDPIFNPQSREVSFVGAVWADQYQGVELGNKETIGELREACLARGLRLVHRTQVSDAEMVAATREARLAPAFAGGWQVAHDYLPCRYFKTAAYGALAFGNVAAAERLLGPASVAQGSLEETLDEALGLGRTRYLNLVREQQRVVGKHYTYRESIMAIDRALGEIRG